MKIPEDKLPLRVGNKLVYGQYAIHCKHPKPTEYVIGKFAGQIAYKDLSRYVVDCANLMPEVIKILTSLKIDAEMALSDEWDRSDDGFEAQIEFIDKILNNFRDETS
jgi:hypothetical protein